MTSEFMQTLKPILIISKISGLINFCCILESGLLYRDTKLTYNLFLESIRMFVYLICTYHICINMGMNYIFLQFNVIKYWSIVITARISEKWIIKFVNGIIEFDRKLLQHRLSDDDEDDCREPPPQRSETFWWTVAFAGAFVYCFACHLNYLAYGTLPDLELSHYTNFAFQSPELIVFVVMISACFYLGSLGRRFRALNELWTGRLSSAGALERIRLLHADLSELLRLFGVGYGPVLLVYFVFTFLHAALETYLITVFRDQRVDVGFIPYVFYAQYVVNMTSVVCVASWVIDKKKKMISYLRLNPIAQMPVDIKLQIKIFMHQISIYESNDLTAFGFFKLDLKLIMSILVLLFTTFATMLQLKSHPFVYHLKNIIVSQFHKPT